MGRGPRLRGLHERLRLALAEYIKFQYTEGVFQMVAHVRALPRTEARLTLVGLGCAALAVIATPIFATLGPRLAGLAFADAFERTQFVPGAAFVLCVALFSLAWGYILSGAAAGPGLLWILTGLFYLFLIGTTGFAIPRDSPWANLHLVAFSLPVLVAALTPGGRTWGKAVLAVLAAGIAMRSTPVPDLVGAPWRLLWVPAGAVMVGIHFLIARRPWSSAVRRTALAVTVTGLYLLAAAALSSPTAVAERFHYSLTLAFSAIELLWFVLGASFVAGAIGLGLFARRMVEVIAADPVPLWGLLAGWIAALLWLKPFEGPPGSLSIAVMLGAALAVLAVRWRRTGMTRAWLAGWFVTSIAVLLIMRANASLDIRDVLTREAGAMSVAAFSYAMIWEVAGRIRKIPLTAPGFAQPSLLLLYLGVLLLVGASTLFGLAANLPEFQKSVILSEYLGAVSLWIPIGLLTLVRGWPAFPANARGRLITAFLIGVGLAVPGFLLRAGTAPGVATAVNVFAIVVVSMLLVCIWPQVRSPLPAAAVGLAAALGFAVSIHRRVLISLLSMMLTMIAGFTRDAPLYQAARRMLVQAFPGTSDELVLLVPWHQADQLIYYGVAPALALGAAVVAAFIATAVVRRRRHADTITCG
ncbi:MAG: hypothetical protein ACT4PY_00925 [Armatimonadota bacterium]